MHPSRPSFALARLVPVGLMLLVVLGFVSSSGSAQEGISKKTRVEEPVWKASTAKGVLTSNPREKADRFPNWPDRDPDFVIVVTGEMHSYLQKCGCSEPQKGGLERRYNLIQSLKNRGWELLPLDLGDVASPAKLRDQGLLKYKVAMESMKEMGYRATSVGIEEFRYSLLDTLSQYSLNNPQPRVLGANVEFKETPELKSLFMKNWEIYSTGKGINVGVVGGVGQALIAEAVKLDKTVSFSPDAEESIKNSLKEMNADKVKPDLRVLLYQDSQKRAEGQAELIGLQSAKRIAATMPDFKIIVTVTDQTEAPTQPILHGESWIIQVGQKGQHVGLIGGFKQPDGQLVLHYHRVTLTPEWETPESEVAGQPILRKLQEYSDIVKREEYLKKSPKFPHPSQGKYPTMKYVGSDACKSCHAEEYAIWSASKHAHAYAALETKASKPSGRNFDPECIRCHTVGFDYNSGFDGTKERTHLKNVGCESCHGPGNLHTDAETRKDPLRNQFYPLLSPWKEASDPKAHLPKPDVIVKLQELTTSESRLKVITAQQEQLIQRVDKTCFGCHDTENDPLFRFEKFMPKIEHVHAKKK